MKNMKTTVFSFFCAAALGGFALQAQEKVQTAPGQDIIIDASDFIGDMTRYHLVADAASLGTDWVFNNFAIKFRTPAGFTIPNYQQKVQLTDEGTYYLYVRAVGNDDGNFRIRLNDQYVDGSFGTGKGASFTRTGPFDLKKGENDIQITRITGTPAIDVLVLSQNPELKEADLIGRQLQDDVVLLKEYDIPSSGCVKFGDLTGDGKTDFVVFSAGYSSYAYANDGTLLWRWEAPEEGTKLRAEFEAPGAVWDFDRDGKAELIQWREFDGKEWLVVADGKTGKIKSKTEWPTLPKPHVYNNFRIAIGHLEGTYPNNIVIYSDCGSQITVAAYTPKLKQMWSYVEKVKKDHFGHYLYPRDMNGDGFDEVLCGWVMLDKDGKVIWSRLQDIYDNHDHVDSYKFADLTGDGKEEIVACASDLGVNIFDAMTGKLLWMHPCEHTQQIQTGMFLKGFDVPQIAAGARVYANRATDPYISGQVQWFDAKGDLITKWPSFPLNGNPDFAKGDWMGDGSERLFWYKFMMQPDGTGKIYFTGSVYHCFDFMRNGAAQVITLERDKLRVWGYKHVQNKAPNNDPDLLRQMMTNHTHY